VPPTTAPQPSKTTKTASPTSLPATCPSDLRRQDGACRLDLPLQGSLQNPAWAPDSAALLFTRFHSGYNNDLAGEDQDGAADLFLVELASGATRTLVADGFANINLPGSAWNAATGRIVFSSTSPGHDEIFTLSPGGDPASLEQITYREDLVAYEPSFSPDGRWIVFESHPDLEGSKGVIVKYSLATGEHQTLTPADQDCRQPNWSPAGDWIVYQKLEAGQWDVWVASPDGAQHSQVTAGPGDKTDASFSPDGRWIVYSADSPEIEYANLFIISISGGAPRQVSQYSGYDGAPSWSPDGTWIAFESHPSAPDGSAGTHLWLIEIEPVALP
jgi:TolB protein